MPRLRLPLLLSAAVVVLLAVLSSAATPPGGAQRQIVLEARSYAFTPERVEVNAGDTVTLRLEAQDVTHGLYVDGYGASAVAVPGRLRRPPRVHLEQAPLLGAPTSQGFGQAARQANLVHVRRASQDHEAPQHECGIVPGYDVRPVPMSVAGEARDDF